MTPVQDLFGVENLYFRILIILGFAISSHLAVLIVRRLRLFVVLIPVSTKSQSKLLSVSSLGTSFLVFGLYFSAFGLILNEFGLSLKTYVASASVLGLAVAFGSQGLVQDVVTGLTLVFSNLLDVGDMVEIGGQTGAVQSISMRFTVLENAMGAEVYIPNRSIMNVVNYPRGYVRCIVDVMLPPSLENSEKLEEIIKDSKNSFVEQFPGIMIYPPSLEGVQETKSGKRFLRLKFRIWPGRGVPIETTFKQEMLQKLKIVDSTYADWMITVYYEVEKVVKQK